MAWNEAVVTTAGMNLLVKCLTDGNIVITRAVGGESCSAALSLLALKSIKEPSHRLNLFRIENEDGKIVVNLRVQNKGLSEEYTLRQIGLFARLEAEDSDVLFAVIQDGTGEVIPKESDNPEFLTEFDFVIPVANAEKIEVELTPDTFAAADDIVKVETELDGHISDKGNPHNVTKKQVGLGNVPDVATNDQTPTYAIADSLTDLSSGEKLSAAFGKLAKAVKSLIEHIGDKIKHISNEERKAWNSKADGDHTHLAATQSAAGLMSADDKKKLDGVAASANNYSLPAASSTVRGGVKIGYTPNGKNYPVQLSNEQMFVNVPWSDTNTTYAGATQSSAGLMSANDKKKLDGVAASANNYSLPAASSTVRGGVKIGYTANGKNYPVQLSNEQMFVNVPWTDTNTTYAGATQSSAGLMSADDKKKLDGIAAGANNYTYSLPAATSTVRGGVKIGYTANGKNYPVQLSNEQMFVNVPWTDNNTTYSAATQSAAGLMSADDKKKLDGVATSANNYSHPTTAGNKHIPTGGASNQILAYSASGTAVWSSTCNAAAVDVVTGNITNQSAVMTVSYKAGRTKALVIAFSDKAAAGYAASGSKLITGISSSMTAQSSSAVCSFSSSTAFSCGVTAAGNIQIVGYTGSYCVIWFN